jgi:hypothetical protein
MALYSEYSTQPHTIVAKRLAGEPAIYAAESAALLAALRAHPLYTPLEIYIDNAAVIARWDKGHKAHGGARFTAPARALWERIFRLKSIRTADTRIRWVHSHPEEGGVKGDTQCACGHQPCDPHHLHHAGNDTADVAAGQGAHADIGTAEFAAGEGNDDYGVWWQNKEQEGDLAACIKAAGEERRRDGMRDTTLRTVQQANAMLEGSHEGQRKRVLKSGKTPYGFQMKAAFDCLPTHKREAQRQEADKSGSYQERYGDTLQGGTCKRCAASGTMCMETIEHILHECPHADARAIRQRAENDIVKEWGAAYDSVTKGGAEWEMFKPTAEWEDGK